MRGASRARQEEGKPRLAFLFVFSGAGQGGLGSVSGGTRGGNTGCLFVGPQDGRMARQRHPHGTGTGAQWNKGAERLRHGKKLCRPHREKGRRKQAPNVRTRGAGEPARCGSLAAGERERTFGRRSKHEEGPKGRKERSGREHSGGAAAGMPQGHGHKKKKKPLQFPARAKYGGPSGTRTPNQLIKSQLLYQLS